jgi:hypothetical protein
MVWPSSNAVECSAPSRVAVSRREEANASVQKVSGAKMLSFLLVQYRRPGLVMWQIRVILAGTERFCLIVFASVRSVLKFL